MTDLKYTVTKFDRDNKFLVVTFEDGGWAQIQLLAPFPKTEADIDALVRQYAPPVEVLEAQTAYVDLSFLEAMIGTERIAQRRYLNPPATPKTAEEIAAEEAARSLSADMIAAEEERRIRSLVQKILSEQVA